MNSTNFKAIGIGKEMTELFNSLEASELNLLNESEYFICPYIDKRKEGDKYCDIVVNDCQHSDWWYSKLIGMKFFCEINFSYCHYRNLNYISRIVGVRLTNTKVIKFRCFDPKDISII